jgi:methylglutaconyl-CoA hydratase
MTKRLAEPESPVADPSDGLRIAQDGPVRRLTLARPERRNALGRTLVAALHAAVAGIGEGGETRVLLLAGEGPAFCAGGDIAEFADAAASGRAEADAAGLADLLAAMAACPAPIVARVHGAAYGGGVGLVCAADVAVAAEGTRFSLSEARLGLVPAVIAPSVVAALGGREAKARMLRAAPFDAAEALRVGLVHQVAPAAALDAAVEEVVADLLRGAPGALTAIKRLPAAVSASDPAATRAATTALLVERLASEEGREGLRAFLEKRPAAWVPMPPEATRAPDPTAPSGPLTNVRNPAPLSLARERGRG